MAWSVTLDVAEPRVLRDRLARLVTGTVGGRLQWDLPNSTGVACAELNGTSFLMPVQFHPSWQTSGAAPYNRLAKADYSLTSAKWLDFCGERCTGDTYLYGLDPAEAVTTHVTWERNRGFYFTYYAFGGAQTFLQFVCRLGTVGVAVYSDGSVRIYKGIATFADCDDAHQVGSGSIIAEAKDAKQRAGTPQGQQTSLVSGAPIDLLVMPWRHRELLVMSNRGGAFSHTFEDITLEDEDPTITTAATMSWQCPTMQAKVQASPLRFATDGSLLTYVQTLRQPPEVAATATCRAYYDLPGYGVAPTCAAFLTDAAGTAAFVPDGAEVHCRVAIAMTGDGTNTPWVYGAAAVLPRTTQDTDDSEEFDLTPYVANIDLTVPEASSGVTLTLRLLSDTLVDAVPQIQDMSNRPIRLDIEGKGTFYGRTGPPRYVHSLNGDMVAFEIECRDPWLALESYRIVDAAAFDGTDIADAIGDLVVMSGYPDTCLDVEEIDYRLPAAEGASDGEWALATEEGDTAASWLDKLTDDFAKGAYVGWYPGAVGGVDQPLFRFRRYMSMPLTSDITIYGTVDEAYTALIAAGRTEAQAFAEAPGLVWRTFRRDALTIEANDVRVTGWDSLTNTFYQAHDEDAASKVPNTAPSARPANWLGENRTYALVNMALNSQAHAEYVAINKRLFLSTVRQTAEIECQMLMRTDGYPIWRGDVITIHNTGVYRVSSFRASLESERGSSIWRPANYTLEYIRREGPDPGH